VSSRVCEAPGCGASLEGLRPQARVCSDACRVALHRARTTNSGAEKPLQRPRTAGTLPGPLVTPTAGLLTAWRPLSVAAGLPVPSLEQVDRAGYTFREADAIARPNRGRRFL
jgi:hypothetical protein